MFIQTLETPNPQTLKFVPGSVVLPKGTVEFLNASDVKGMSPLADRLFGVEGVRSIFYGTDFVAVTKNDDATWQDIRTYVLGVLFEFFSSEQSVMTEDVATENHVELSETAQKIVALIDERVRPAVARDGGDIIFVKFEKGVVWLKMHGACSGCPSSTVTLKMGIENMLRNYIPEVLEVRALEN